MVLIISLLIAGVFFLGAFYFLEFNMELDGKKEIIIKDGLVRELITKAVADPDPNSFIIDTDLKTITMGRIVIQKHWSDMFWFPYKVEKLSKEYNKRVTDDDWGGTIGYVRRYSKDYQHIKALLKKDKVNIEKTQREKLNLNK
jgi:hypothetical protein